MCSILECVSQAQQIFWNIVMCFQYIFIQRKNDFSIGAISIDMLNIRSVSLSSGLIYLPLDCIKKTKQKTLKNLLCVVANILVGFS